MPLLRRGWVYQERLLSPRLVHFAANEIMWECTGETLCSCAENGEYPAPEDPRYGLRVKEQHFWALGRLKPTLLLRENLKWRWYDMVREYTTLDLSFGSDRLPAMAGLAKELEMNIMRSSLLRPEHGNLYVHGLWRDTFLQDILWFVDEPSNIQRKPLQRQAPSWSWASINGPVSYPKNKLGRRERFLPAAELISLTDLPSQAFAILTGHASRTQLVCHNALPPGNNFIYVIELAGSFHPVFLDYHRFGPRSTSIDKYEEAYCLQTGSFEESRTQYFVLFARTRLSKPNAERIEGIDAEYVRIGLAIVDPTNNKHDISQSLQKSGKRRTFLVI